jgi:hypothetical protein
MNNNIITAIDALVNLTINSTDGESLIQQIKENKDDVIESLQFIGNADLENHINTSHYSLFKCCPKELESHVCAAQGVYLHIINTAWNEFEENIEAAINSFLGIETEDAPQVDADTISHLESCLAGTPTWSF